MTERPLFFQNAYIAKNLRDVLPYSITYLGGDLSRGMYRVVFSDESRQRRFRMDRSTF